MKVPPLSTTTRNWPGSGQEWAWGVVLVLAVLVSYLPVWRAGFVWDDFAFVVANKCLVGLHGLKQIWTTDAADICPLTLTTLNFEHTLWGFAPRPYHVVNVALHATSAVVLWRVLLEMEVPGAWLGAALWAVHPVEVESVAWVSELKNTQSALFFLLAILFFLRWLKTSLSAGWDRDFGLMLVCSFLAMASKSSTVILPVVLCLCAWWMQRRLDVGIVVRLIPVFFISAAASALSLWTQHESLAVDGDRWVRTWPERIVAAGDAVWFYLGKLLWPHPVVTIYPRWHIDAGAVSSYLPALAVIATVAVLAAYSSGWARPWFMAFAFFLVALLPAVGLLDNVLFRYSFVFDHLQYLASMGPLALAGAGLFRLGQQLSPANPRMPAILGGGLLALLGVLTWQRARTFHSDVTLWTATLPINPVSWLAYNNLGCDAFNRGDTDVAIGYFWKAIAGDPKFHNPYANLEDAYDKQKRKDEAVALDRKALLVFPNDANFHYHLGMTLIGQGIADEGFAELQKARQLDPKYTAAWDSIGTVYLHKGAVDEAIAAYEKAVSIDPDFALGRNHLGLAYFQKGRVADAIVQYRKSILLNPKVDEVHNNLGTALAQSGQLDDALAEFQKAVELGPRNFEAHRNLGSAWFQKGQLDPAIEQFNQAIAITPSDVPVHTLLGLAYGRKGDIPAAIAQFREVLRLKPGDAAAQHYLAQAQAMSAGGAK